MNLYVPDATYHDPDPLYLRILIERSGFSQRGAAYRIGISERVMRYYLSPKASAHHIDAPYCVQYALEVLAVYHQGD